MSYLVYFAILATIVAFLPLSVAQLLVFFDTRLGFVLSSPEPRMLFLAGSGVLLVRLARSGKAGQ